MVGCCELHRIVSSRLTEVQKKEILEGYRSGKSTSVLADSFGCSPNTVSRTVKALLPASEYTALKAARAKGDISNLNLGPNGKDLTNQELSSDQEALAGQSEVNHPDVRVENDDPDDLDLDDDVAGPLALDDADDFGDEIEESTGSEDLSELELREEFSSELFQEVVPLASGFDLAEPKEVKCLPFSPEVLPGTVYMVVDKTVELDTRSLKEFPELGLLNEEEKDRQAICLFANQRAAKRFCGRSQRVIKVPNSTVFELSTPYLLARGITRIVLEGDLIALDLPAV